MLFTRKQVLADILVYSQNSRRTYVQFYNYRLNILAELLRFGDREFYKDWWNAKTVEEVDLMLFDMLKIIFLSNHLLLN